MEFSTSPRFWSVAGERCANSRLCALLSLANRPIAWGGVCRVLKNGRRLRRIQNGAVEDQERSVRGDFSQIVEALGVDIATEGYTLSGMVNPVDHGRRVAVVAGNGPDDQVPSAWMTCGCCPGRGIAGRSLT